MTGSVHRRLKRKRLSRVAVTSQQVRKRRPRGLEFRQDGLVLGNS